MAVSDQHQIQVINQIVECLSSTERRNLLYLCGILDADSSEVCMKEMLKCEVVRRDTGHLLLKELMLRMRRFDILRKVCQTSRDEVEKTLTHRQVLPRFRVLMANISEDLDEEDLNGVKFLLSSTLSREKREKAKSFLDVIIELEKLDLVSPERVDLVHDCLKNIGRVDLAKKVSAYRMPAGTSEQHSAQQPRSRLPHLFPPPSSSHLTSVQGTRQGQHLLSATASMSVYNGPSSQSQLEFYKFSSNPRGVCVIIDCVGNDGGMLVEAFQALHFKVVLHKWLSADDTLSALRGMLRQRENFEGDAFVCCIISRGTTTHLLGTDSYGVGLHMGNLRRLFTPDACPMLAGKPKLFFIQRYSIPEFHPCARMDHRDEDLETDGCDGLARCNQIPNDADVFWSHCWTDDGQLEQVNHCSFYLKSVTAALQKGQRWKTHLVDLHTEVNGAVSEHNKRDPGAKYHMDVKYTLRKALYFVRQMNE